MENDALPQYMRIARSIAQRIADGELMEGEKLSGRSKLSSEYNVSPETIRKAVQVLQDRAVVIVREQSVLNCCTSVANDIVAVCNGQEPQVKAQKPKF